MTHLWGNGKYKYGRSAKPVLASYIPLFHSQPHSLCAKDCILTCAFKGSLKPSLATQGSQVGRLDHLQAARHFPRRDTRQLQEH